MRGLENMVGRTCLSRRGAVYYRRSAIPKDIAVTYPKAEETFSLKTRDYAEALRRVRMKSSSRMASRMQRPFRLTNKSLNNK